MSSSSSKRKSRWGTRTNDNESGGRGRSTFPSSSSSSGAKASVGGGGGVSEAEAIAALLSDAQRSKDAKLPPPKHHREGNRAQRENVARIDAGGGNLQRERQNAGPGVVEDETKEMGRKRKRSRWGDEADDADAASSEKWGKQQEEEEEGEKSTAKEKQKANFGLSGALATDDQHGNVYNGVLLKFSEPPEARVPNTRWRLYVFRSKHNKGDGDDENNNDDEPIDILHISKQSAYLFGRETRVADIPVHHPSLSKQHAVLQYRAVLDSKSGKMLCRPYLMDLGSTNGTFLNGVKIGEARYYELRKGDVVRLGHSSREYVLLTENTTGVGG